MVKIVAFAGNKARLRPSSIVRTAGFLLFSGVLAACAAPKTLVETEKDDLFQRVTERWRCLEASDYGCAYQYSSPAYRAVFSQAMYQNKPASILERRLTGVKLVAYDPSAAVASVAVGVMSRPTKFTSSASRAIGALPATLNESWIRVDGDWWYVDGS